MAEEMTKLFSFDLEQITKYELQLLKDLREIEDLNKSDKNKNLDTIAAAQYGAEAANKIPWLLREIRKFQNEVGFYEFHRERVANAGK